MNRKSRSLVAGNRSATRAWLSPLPLTIAALIFHVAVTTAIYCVGRSQLLPGAFNPAGLAISFVPDGARDLPLIVRLSEEISAGQLRSWVNAPYPFHFKLYSIGFAIFGPALGFTIIAAEPLNALCYLGSLILIVKLGQEAFNRSAGLLAAVIVGLWPSFLLHTTQLLKDPFFILGMLAFILVIVRLILRSFSWPRSLAYGAAGGCVSIFLWLTRDNMGELMIVIGFLGAGMLIVRQLIERQFLATNTIGLMLLLVMALSVSRVVPKFNDPIGDRSRLPVRSQSDEVAFNAAYRTRPTTPSWDLPTRVMRHRSEFIRYYPDAASNIDQNVELLSKADLIRYLPRAAVIGFFAPFPNMWFSTGGHVGSSGRLLSGLEMLAIYLVEGFALVGFWRGRRRLSTWYLASVAAMGMVALGLVVINVGALYRLRYIFLILLIVLAAEGAVQSLNWWRGGHKRESAPSRKELRTDSEDHS